MSKQINMNEQLYKKFQAALILTGEDEEQVLNRLLEEYVRGAFETAMGKAPEVSAEERKPVSCTAGEQKQLFVNWFRSLTRNGRPYNPVTISGYTGRIENACCDPAFASVPVRNLFSITTSAEFRAVQKQIKACAGYAAFDAKTHNGFTAALKKYEEFLRMQESGDEVQPVAAIPRQYGQPSAVHRWTEEEDSICCKRFLEYYVVHRSDMDTVSFLQMLAREVPAVSEGSLRMKVQNIRYLAMKAGLQDTSKMKWLSQYSMQCEKMFVQAMQELNLP